MKFILFSIIICSIYANIFGQNFTSKYYYLGEINDLRLTEKNTIGSVFVAGKAVKIPLKLPNGELNYLKKKLDTKLAANAVAYKINLALTNLFFTEKPKNDFTAIGSLNFEGSFYTLSSSDSTVVFPFKYTVSYIRKIEDEAPLYNLLDSKLTDLQKQLETYFEKNFAKNYKLARHVTVKTSDYLPSVPDNDTLYFLQRRVNFNDFSSKPNNKSKYAAAIFTSMGYMANSKMSNDTVIINLTAKVYQIKGMSWAIAQADNVNSLNHEQTHFNITQLIAEKFKERLREESLPPQDFDSRIQYLYIEYFRKINKLQDQYDLETEHGLNREKQIYWENYIKTELAKFGVNL